MSRTIVVAILLATSTAQASAAELSPLGAVIGGEEAKAVVDKADQLAQNAIASAAREGNGLVAHTASELTILTNNARLMLGSTENTLVKDLGVPEANLLGEISALSHQLDDAQNKAYFIRDVTLVDVSNLTAALPFTNVPFFVQKVSGLSQVIGDADYKFQVVARGIEAASSESASAVNVTIDGRPVPAQISVSTRGVADIVIGSSVLNPFFAHEDRATVVKAAFEVTVVTHPKKRFLRTPPDTTTKISAPVWVTLYPKYAGEITVTAYVPVLKWVRLDAAHEVKTASMPVLTIADFDLRVPLGASSKTPGAQRIVGAYFTCDQTFSAQPNGFCGPGAYWTIDVAPTATLDETYVKGTIKNRGEKLWFTLHAVVDELRVDPVQLSDVKRYVLTWDTPIRIELPNGWSNYRIDGKSVTKREIHLNENTSMEPFLKFESLGAAPPAGTPLPQYANYRVGHPE
jgi:hypothetical protein